MTVQEIQSLLARELDGDEIQRTAAEWQKYPLQLSYRAYADGIAFLQRQYASYGLESELITFPADGKTTYADRHFPLAWDVDNGWAEVNGIRVADYREKPYSVIPFSADSGGICEKRLVPIESLPQSGSLENCAALICHYPQGEEIRMLVARGCPAFLSTFSLEPVDPSLEDARRWYNNLFSPGQIDCRDKTCVGFSITPRAARELLRKHNSGAPLTVRYQMKTRAYAGSVPAVTAVIPGTDDSRCFFITAHAYEPHATNNVAGVAMCLCVAKTLMRLIRSGRLPRPKHSIRFFHGLENFSLYAWGMSHRKQMNAALGGISTDSFGRFGAGGKVERFVLRRCLNIHPSSQHALAREILDRACAEAGIGYEVREGSSNNEEMMQDPMFGPAWNLLYGSLWEEPVETKPLCYFYHTDIDTVDQLSPQMLVCAGTVSAALAYSVASESDLPQRAARAFADWKRIVDEKCLEAMQLADTDPSLRILRAQRLRAWCELAAASGSDAIADSELSYAFRAYVGRRLAAAAQLLCGGSIPKLAHPNGYDTVLRRTVPGPIGLGTISEELRKLAAQSQGYYAREYWCLDPSGTNLYLFDGKRTVFEVARDVWATRSFGTHENPAALERELHRYSLLAEVLDKGALAERVPPVIVTGDELLCALRSLEIAPGEMLMVHCSLRSFGRVEGGADTVIQALRDAVGPNGIVAMPAFTNCIEGGTGGPFDPHTTPVAPWISAVAERFRTLPDTLRSIHPTHSVCAAGKNAAAFLSQNEPYDCFAADGPWGCLKDDGGKILLIGSAVGSNTFLHACEAWYLGYLDETIGLVACDGQTKHVRVTNYPGGCRGGWYKRGKNAPYFQALSSRGIFRTASVGCAELYLCSAEALACAMREIFAENPYILLHPDGCDDCARMKGKRDYGA